MAVGLLARSSGRQLPLQLLAGDLAPSSGDVGQPGTSGATTTSSVNGSPLPTTLVLLISTDKQSWVFGGVDEEPVVSLLRGCSAPVALAVRGRRDADLALLAAHDLDPFVR